MNTKLVWIKAIALPNLEVNLKGEFQWTETVN